MATLTWPAALKPRSFLLDLSVNQRINAAPFGGSEQAIDLLNDRWIASIVLPDKTPAEAAAVEALSHSFRGATSNIALWHMARPIPRGSLRGAPTLAADVALGASAIGISNAVALATLYAGDLIGINGLLLMVASDCTANGSGVFASVQLVNRLRKACGAGSPIAWDRPTCLFRRMAGAAPRYAPGNTGGVQWDFSEYIA